MTTMNITLEQFRAGYARNAVSLQKRYEKILASGKNRTGFTLDELQQHADSSLRLSLLTDDELRAHLLGVMRAMQLATVSQPVRA